jgi:predicted O-methyltransferase YrrM
MSRSIWNTNTQFGALAEQLPASWLLGSRVRARARTWKLQPNSEFIDRMKQRSMLHQETLCLLDYFARRARRGVLEIGAYIGGGTGVVARALIEAENLIPFATIEVGGSYPTQPHLPSDDILGDLRKTLTDNGLIERATILEGWSNAPATVAAVNSIFTKGIDLLIVDSDGQIARDFQLYRDLLVPGAIIVCDDYACEGANVKELPVRQWVQSVVETKTVREIGIFQWGTWFGVYNP